MLFPTVFGAIVSFSSSTMRQASPPKILDGSMLSEGMYVRSGSVSTYRDLGSVELTGILNKFKRTINKALSMFFKVCCLVSRE